ncbi:MAG: hypothetical protein GX221_10405 [Candidatus Riflebacteria bacterium]|nr:hypothetical protein [Candidatus Riflebacteria bacterium]
MKQSIKSAVAVAKLVITSAARKGQITAVMLLSLLFFLPALFWETAFEGSQTLLIIDTAYWSFYFFSAALALTISLKTLPWLKESDYPYFYFTNLNNKISFYFGAWLGTFVISSLSLFVFAILWILFSIFFAKAMTFHLIFSMAASASLTSAIFIALILFFSTFLSKITGTAIFLASCFVRMNFSYAVSAAISSLGKAAFPVIWLADILIPDNFLCNSVMGDPVNGFSLKTFTGTILYTLAYSFFFLVSAAKISKHQTEK